LDTDSFPGLPFGAGKAYRLFGARMKLTLGLYGLFLLLVAIQGNSQTLITNLQADAPHFFPWLIVAAVLGGLYEYPPTHGLAASFLLLVVLTFVLINFNNIKSQFGTIYSKAGK
jgi:RsiW-degrading membrane proteinase PrsW (M82 family)